MQIFIRTFTNPKYITLDVDPSDTIENIKHKIYDKLAMCIHIQNLSYGSKILEEDKTLEDYKIQRDSTLNLEIFDRGINMFDIENENNTILVLHFICPFCVTVQSFKSRIQDKLGLKVEFQELSYNGIILKDLKTLNNYGINGGCKIHLKIKAH